MNNQINLFGKSKAQTYHEDNPHIYKAFEMLTFKAISKGFKHYGTSGIFELIRWHTGVTGTGKYKIANDYKPCYGRLFEKKNPEHEGFFRKKMAMCDIDFV